MGNCCSDEKSSSGGSFVRGSSQQRQTYQNNNISRQRSKREHNWAVTGQITLRDSNLKVDLSYADAVPVPKHCSKT